MRVVTSYTPSIATNATVMMYAITQLVSRRTVTSVRCAAMTPLLSVSRRLSHRLLSSSPRWNLATCQPSHYNASYRCMSTSDHSQPSTDTNAEYGTSDESVGEMPTRKSMIDDIESVADDIRNRPPPIAPHPHEGHQHANEPSDAAKHAPLQGLAAEDLPLSPTRLPTADQLFTPQQFDALIVDLRAFIEQFRADGQTQTPSPTEPSDRHMLTSPVSSQEATSLPSHEHPVNARVRPFLASWSVKEVASWMLQVEEELRFATPSSDATTTSPEPPALSFTSLVVKHEIDGLRLLSLLEDPRAIPWLHPELLSRIMYLRGLDSYHEKPTIPTSERERDNIAHALAGTVKIFCTSTAPDFARPWATQDQEESTSSGFVISDRRIIGNAHGVTHATIVRVRKNGDSVKYKARVEAVSHEADLCLLRVDDERFWTGMEPLRFGDFPRLQQTVVVVGYPIAGDNVCVTKGVVSRILVSNYVHSGESLMTVQIDAAINGGNSGGPVLLDGLVVGVAFQGISHAQSIGFVIPIPIVLHFLSDLKLNGRYTGYPSFAGVVFQKLENEAIKKYFTRNHLLRALDPSPSKSPAGNDPTVTDNNNALSAAPSELSGIVVSSVAPLDGAAGVLKPNDVIVTIDGVPVADDGTVLFRAGERVSARYLPTSKFVGDHITCGIIRDGKPMDVRWQLKARQSLVPVNLYDTQPSYFVIGGLCFTVLSRPYLQDTFGREWQRRAPCDLVNIAYYGSIQHPEQQVIVLSTIFTHDVNNGYGSHFHNIVLDSVNDVKIVNLRHLVEVVEKERNAKSSFLRFDFQLNRVIVLETESAFDATPAILQINNIEHDRSRDLRLLQQSALNADTHNNNQKQQ